ncbi:MAG: GNAT family N-acetyltransferase [Clostridiales bacterium]|uniref:GNAT family N-acetyltransferase n=1 Tax=Caproiciproducens sp. MSJ-32 TaxID=2841527 RepID=UPI00179B0309|nr:GNAT family protein [Caproiciproducens sp. MSJ-32]MBU5454480.1 GNAT family N-acetyltransferase [Caproiciproducens sp. MSJ-32]NLZ35196.1 GNAT family N-acetyltransferase [Clostridiales bacterium]
MINLKYKPTIEGNKVILRPFESQDIDFMVEALEDKEVMKFTGSSAFFDKEFLINWYNTRNEQVDRLDLAIIDKANNTVVGEVVINEYDEIKHSMNFRILIGPGGRNRGLGTEATILVCDYIFLNTDLKELTLGVYAFNPRAQRVYEKAGFILDSIDKADLEYEGEMIDALNMVLTRKRWEEIYYKGDTLN